MSHQGWDPEPLRRHRQNTAGKPFAIALPPPPAAAANIATARAATAAVTHALRFVRPNDADAPLADVRRNFRALPLVDRASTGYASSSE